MHTFSLILFNTSTLFHLSLFHFLSLSLFSPPFPHLHTLPFPLCLSLCLSHSLLYILPSSSSPSPPSLHPHRTLRQGWAQNVTLSVNCPNVHSMEHVKAHISLQAYRRGDVSLVLYSPFGTPSRLIDTRIHDNKREGLTDWPFMTVHNWGEDPNGQWILQFRFVYIIIMILIIFVLVIVHITL